MAQRAVDQADVISGAGPHISLGDAACPLAAAFVCGFLLRYVDEETAFWMFVSLMQDNLYKLRLLYGPGVGGFHMMIYQVSGGSVRAPRQEGEGLEMPVSCASLLFITPLPENRPCPGTPPGLIRPVRHIETWSFMTSWSSDREG